MTELLYLGGGGGRDLSPWGMSALGSTGCLCTTRWTGRWTALVGRPRFGLLAATVADLNLRVAVVLHELALPAALARAVVAFAVREFVERVRPADTDDWLTLVRAAQDISHERIEDYVAVATAGGPLVPETSRNRIGADNELALARSDVVVVAAAGFASRAGAAPTLGCPVRTGGEAAAGADPFTGRRRPVVGPTRLRAEVDPPALASSVVFPSTAGTCAPPSHRRSNANGMREELSPSIRCASSSTSPRRPRGADHSHCGVGFAETVDVDVVQVTVTVMDDQVVTSRDCRSRRSTCRKTAGRKHLAFLFAGAPLELMVAVDISGSMKARCRSEESRSGVPRRRARTPSRHVAQFQR